MLKLNLEDSLFTVDNLPPAVLINTYGLHSYSKLNLH